MLKTSNSRATSVVPILFPSVSILRAPTVHPCTSLSCVKPEFTPYDVSDSAQRSCFVNPASRSIPRARGKLPLCPPPPTRIPNRTPSQASLLLWRSGRAHGLRSKLQCTESTYAVLTHQTRATQPSKSRELLSALEIDPLRRGVAIRPSARDPPKK